MLVLLTSHGPRLSSSDRVPVRNGLGQLASELLAHALAITEDEHPDAPLEWTVRPMHARVDLGDRDAVQRILDAGQ